MSLIQCHRHTKEDLKLWEAYERADLVYYEMNQAKIQEKIEKAIESIREFSKEPCYCGVSWGKDSLVVSHLVHLSGCDIPLVNLKIIPSQNPYCLDVRDSFLKRFKCRYDEIIVDYTEILKKRLCDKDHDKETDKLFFKGFLDAGEKYGHRHISGIRGQESMIRRIRMGRFKENSINTSAPIGFWNTKEVFAYLTHNDLPIHPNYAMLCNGLLDRDNLRVAELGDTHGKEFGRQEWEMKYYPDLMRRNIV